MAKNRKKRRQEMEAAGLTDGSVTKASRQTAKATPPPPPPPKKGPATQPKKAKVKRPKYVRPARVAPKPKPETQEPAGPKPITFAALTLTSSVAKTILKPGAELPDRPGPGVR